MGDKYNSSFGELNGKKKKNLFESHHTVALNMHAQDPD